MGRRKAAVLPEPVWAQAIRSLPSRMMASPCFCTGVRTEYLARRTFSRRTVARPELGKSRTGEGLFSPTIW